MTSNWNYSGGSLSSNVFPASDVTVQPVNEPVTRAEVKANANIISDNSYDGYIDNQLIPAARRIIEELAKRSLITQTRVQYYDDLPEEMYLRYGPTQSVTSVTYKDSNETQQTLAASNYVVDTARIPGRIIIGYDDTYPNSIWDTNSVAVTMVNGYGDSSTDVPDIYRRAIIELCTFWHYNRSPITCGEGYEATMRSIERMLAIEGVTVEYA